MSVIRRLTDLQYRVLDRLRHRDAFRLADRPATAADFTGLHGARQCLVVSFKRSGEAVPTPVNFGLSDETHLYFRCEPRSAKALRIRRDPEVLVAPCDFRGKPTGAAARGTARVVSPADRDRADAVVAANWTPAMRALERGLDRMPLDLVYVEVTPA